MLIHKRGNLFQDGILQRECCVGQRQAAEDCSTMPQRILVPAGGVGLSSRVAFDSIVQRVFTGTGM